MENLSGCLIARLAARDETYADSLIDEINQRVHPPRPVTGAEVYIRAMYIVSDQINSQGGRFADEELDRLTALLTDSPVMVGHRRDSLPVARNFKAEKVEIEGRQWVKSYFYWMKDSEGAEDLRKNIDGGIYKECSVSFLFGHPECSICGRDIRQCRHVPFQEYEIAPGRKEIAHFIYRRIEKVLETSLVFRGAVPDTSITDRLSSPVRGHTVETDSRKELFCKLDAHENGIIPGYGLSQAPLLFTSEKGFRPNPSAELLYCYPYQPGLMVTIIRRNDATEIVSSIDLNEKVKSHLVNAITPQPREPFIVDALLFATRGRDRLDGFGLTRLLASGTNLHRLRLRICDIRPNGSRPDKKRWSRRLEDARVLFGDSLPDGIELLHLQQISASEWRAGREEENQREYNYGLEIVTEDTQGRLVRHILNDDDRCPAVVDKVISENRTHAHCRLSTVGHESHVTTVAIPVSQHASPGNLLLVRPRSTGRHRKNRSWSVVDLLPGISPTDILPSFSRPDTAAEHLHLIPGANRLNLYYRRDEAWHKVTVHHFSRPLFARGRKFIADCNVDLFESDSLLPGEAVPLASMIHRGNLVFLKPAANSELLGNTPGIWLRPVLIDGNERYLFYAENITSRPQEG